MLIKNLFFKRAGKIQAFMITRLQADEIAERVMLTSGPYSFDITRQHGMICLAPFCMAVWLPQKQADMADLQFSKIEFINEDTLNARIWVSLIEQIQTEHGVLLLYKILKVGNYQLSILHRLVFFGYLLRAKNNTYHHREVISALYSYPRSIIIVSYRDADYCNIFPMDIHSYIEAEGLYLLGLRTTNITLDKILEAKKVVICDTSNVDIDTVYNLGKHSSKVPTPVGQLSFGVSNSEMFGFPVPEFSGWYKEVEIVHHQKMGYHMLLLGKVVNKRVIRQNPASLYHVGFLQAQQGNYKSMEGLF
ncbi:hypothetical protein HQ865_09150 [Mucilaginibacter mali]|uniref:Flavin reductase like domain-containing protein n=1 Tax=Mucilaginibacter mali TaxID=2740462 RepID=A0A7D4TUS5_9SPHI|nr:hypothetical protein [Mucilaginibacter mali]QKJ29915.1 hypothetical protein HQ865_09150 [Mucilaginibacter mali]